MPLCIGSFKKEIGNEECVQIAPCCMVQRSVAPSTKCVAIFLIFSGSVTIIGHIKFRVRTAIRSDAS